MLPNARPRGDTLPKWSELKPVALGLLQSPSVVAVAAAHCTLALASGQVRAEAPDSPTKRCYS
eukprot:4677775-Amphidinium_carterae.1